MLAYTIVMAVVNLLLTGRNVWITSSNQYLKNQIHDLVNIVNRELKAKKLSIDKLMAIASTKNANAMMTYLQTNPVISKGISSIKADSEMLASLQAERNSLENQLNDAYNQLNSLGYSQSLLGTFDEDERRKKLKGQIKQLKSDYDKFEDKVKSSTAQLGTTQPMSTYTADLDAKNQNVNGGLNNNGIQ